MTDQHLPIKKQVTLPWDGERLSFEVAQDLFSSHQVDKGSRMLLDSLSQQTFPDVGEAADFGCGYGVLGIAWQARHPGWAMQFIDRDALAVAFSAHNAARLGDGRVSFHHAIALPGAPGGYGLVLWNVPGKAGRRVIEGLLHATLDALAPSGLLAVVVVHPLADLFSEPLARADVHVEAVQRGTEHTVVHLRRVDGSGSASDPFFEGLFDRAPATFGAGGLRWTLTPVIGLPEYDELSHATVLSATAMVEAAGTVPVGRWLIVEPGAGHLAVLASRLWADAHGAIASRDALALRATGRAIDGYHHGSHAMWGAPDLRVEQPVDLAVMALEVQSSAEDIHAGLDAIAQCVAPSGQVILHGRSTEVARAERTLRRLPGWRTARPAKQRGFAALAVRTPSP